MGKILPYCYSIETRAQEMKKGRGDTELPWGAHVEVKSCFEHGRTAHI